jgi:hypothetical protein
MKSLYVANLPHSTIEAEVRNLFEVHGAVEKVILVTDRRRQRYSIWRRGSGHCGGGQPQWPHQRVTRVCRSAGA